MSAEKERIYALEEEIRELKKELEQYKITANPTNQSINIEQQDFGKFFEEKISASALHRMIFDEQGKPVSYVFVRVNQMFERMTGLKAEDIIGKNVREVIPDLDEIWIETYGRVVKTGASEELEQHVPGLDKYFRVQAYRFDNDHFVVSFIDITDRKKSHLALLETQKNLSESEDFLRSIIRVAPTGIGVVSNRLIKEVNEMVSQMTGYTRDELIGQSSRIFYADDDEFNRVGVEKYALIAKTGTGHIETIWQKKNGEKINVLLSSTPISSTTNIAENVTFTALDITGLKQAEKTLRESEERFRSIIENSSDLFYIQTPDNQLVYVSPQANEMLGYDRVDHFHTWMDALTDHPANQKGFEQTMKAISEGKRQEPYELQMKHSSGKHIWVEVRETPLVENGKTVALVGALINITRQKEAEQKLHENEVKLQTIVTNLNGIVYRCKNDESWTMIYLSAGTKGLTGYSTVELLNNRSTSYQSIIYQEDRNKVFNIVEKAIQRGHKYQLEYRITTKGGKLKWVYEQGSGIKNDRGELIYLEGYIFDISSRKEMELEIVRKNKEIAAQNEEYLSVNEELHTTIEQIKAINEELERAKQKAEESDRLKSAFLANMSHEIRTPMNSIIGFSGLLAEEHSSQKDRERYSELILSAGEHLLRIIDDIVDIAKIESNQLKIEKLDQNLYGILQDVYSLHSQGKLRFLKPDVNLVLNTEMVPRKLTIYTDPIRLKQVLSNLISNALKNTESGTVEFGIKTIQNNDGGITFYVKDTGRGISEENRVRIFERFFQIKGKGLSPGTGLGLSITKGILTLLNGDIWLESEPGKGSVFYFSLPGIIHQQMPEPLDEPKRSFRIPQLDGKLIYIAEDDPSSFLLLSEILEITRVKIRQATDGEMLVKMVQNHVPDLILADINMPGMSGIEAVKALRKQQFAVPVIAQTAYALLEEKENCLKAGCSAYISKPIDANLLFELINQYIKQPEHSPGNRGPI